MDFDSTTVVGSNPTEGTKQRSQSRMMPARDHRSSVSYEPPLTTKSLIGKGQGVEASGYVPEEGCLVFSFAFTWWAGVSYPKESTIFVKGLR